MRYLMLAVATIVATALVACGKKNDSVANPNLGCVPGQNGCAAGVNGYGYGYGYGIGVNNRLGGYLENIGEDAFAQMLGQYGGFCLNNGWNNYPGQLSNSRSVGTYNCKTYAAAGYVNIRFDQTGTRAQITVGAGGTRRGMFAAPRQEVHFNGRVIAINNSAGMQIRGSGAQATGSWSAQYDNGLVIHVEQGTLASTVMNATVTYRGRSMGTVQLTRY